MRAKLEHSLELINMTNDLSALTSKCLNKSSKIVETRTPEDDLYDIAADLQKIHLKVLKLIDKLEV